MTDEEGYGPDQVYEKGKYKNGRRTGLWKRYYPNGKLISEITYKRGRQYGPYKTYYKNGQLQEKGFWKYRKVVGDFKRYHKNGQVAHEFNYNESGKREGEQKYYHPNGEVQIEVNMKNGKEDGVMKRYYPNGELKKKKVFNGGKVDKSSIEKFEAEAAITENTEDNAPKKKVADKEGKMNEAEDEDKTQSDQIPDGYHTLYNDDKQVTQKGLFKDGRLYEGEWRKYDENGILIKKELYRKGIYIGEGQIEEEEK